MNYSIKSRSDRGEGVPMEKIGYFQVGTISTVLSDKETC
jgi:hypothetical protein